MLPTLALTIACAVLALGLLLASTRRLAALPRADEAPGIALRAGLVLVVAAGLTVVTMRRQGLTHLVGSSLVPLDRPPAAPPLARPDGLIPRAPLAQDLTILLLDGLRVDAAEASPAWRELASRGARLRARLRFPVKSSSARSLLITGAPPEVTGVVGNVIAPSGVDHLLRRAARAGFEVTEAESPWSEWLGLAPLGAPDAALAPRAPGQLGRRLVVEDHFVCDDAGHALGAASEEYRQGVELVSERVLEAVRNADLSRHVIVALSDHGHLDRGGHAGLEPEVATAPVLLLGAGVRAGFAQDAPVPMEDVGATLSLLLGLPPPELSRGVPVLDALQVPPADAPALRAAFVARRDDLAAAWARTVHPERVRALRVLGAALFFAGLLLLLRPRLDGALLLALTGPLLASALRLRLAPPVSADIRWGPPPHAAIVFAALLLSVLALRASGATLDRAARALLAAWSLPVVFGLAVVGLGPSGLPPVPWAFGLAVATHGLCGVAFAIGLATLHSGPGPVRTHRP